MPRVWKLFAAAASLPAVLLIVAVLAADRAVAQEPAGITGAAGDTTVAASPVSVDATLAATRHKHRHLFAVSAHSNWRVPVRILKENKRNINDIMSSAAGFDAGLRCYLLDGLALGARYARGGLDLTDNALDLSRFNLTGDEYLKLDSYTVWFSAYLGNALLPNSRFNPYLTLSASRYDWAFTQGGRDGESYVILETPVEGRDIGLAGGIGCEYALGDRLWLETEWSWNYILTELDRTDGVFGVWTNTHYWNLGLGLVLGF
jgi:opacity protein-like surface antigen